MQFWEDLNPGQQFETGTLTLLASDIIEFATEFDPQPYHLNPEVAQQSIFGGHCASGWQVCALMMRLLADTLERDGIPSAGSREVGSLRWLKPVFANDTLDATIRVLGRRELPSQPDYGLVDLSITVRNQHQKPVIELESDILVARTEKNNDGE